MSNIDWSKAPEGFQLWLEDIRPNIDGECRSGWARQGKGGYEFLGGGWWTASHENVFYTIYKKPVDALEWTGEGLPPVGTVCLLSGKTPILDPIHPHWAGSEVKIYAHFKTDQGRELAAYVSEDHMKGGVGVEKLFLPIRTAEQIAAIERKKAIGEMIDIYKSNYEGHVADGCQALYDAGWRKQVQP